MCKAVVGSSPTLKKNRAHAMYFDRWVLHTVFQESA
jgi:hypothetical protein